MSTIVAASPMPLFDRIAGFPDASVDGRLMDSGGLRRSLLRDLSRLLNVRNGMSVKDFLDADPSVLDYGLPDLLALSAQSEEDLHLLGKSVARAIALYEPRLSHVQVTAAPDGARKNAARVAIAAAVMVGPQLCRVDFDLLLDSQTLQLEEAQ
jgi:type VI secretion system lysozyme-like protein